MPLVHKSGFDAGNPDAFLLPEYLIAERAKRMGVPIYHLLEPKYAATVHAVNNAADARDLSHRLGGRAVMPKREIVLVGADGQTAIVIPGAGVTEAAELEDVALEAYEAQEAKLRAGKPLVDFDELRERAGLPPRKEFDSLFRQAMQDRIARHKANPRTDPARQPLRTRGLIPVGRIEREGNGGDSGAV
jgi:hypothetical protein